MGSVDLQLIQSVGSSMVLLKALNIFLLVFKGTYHPNNMTSSQLLNLVGCWRKKLAVVLNLLTEKSYVVFMAHFQGV